MKIFDTWSKFVSTREPYASDTYVQRVFEDVTSDGRELARRYAEYVRGCQLSSIVKNIVTNSGSCSEIRVIDCGVYMGHFSVAAHILLNDFGVQPVVTLVEANPDLSTPIEENLRFYGVSNYQLVSSALAFSETGRVTLGISKQNQIGAALVRPGSVPESVNTVDVATVSLNSFIDTKALNLIKLDLEGVEQQVFDDLEESHLQNYFIIEFAPSQAVESCGGSSYAEFLLKHFAIYNLGDWLRTIQQDRPQRISSQHELENVSARNRAANVDLLLVPKGFPDASSFYGS